MPSQFEREFLEHRNHPEFRIDDSVRELTIGFTCGCNNGTDSRITLNEIRQLGNSARIRNLRQDYFNRHPQECPFKTLEKGERRAAKLLKSNLSRFQRNELKHLREFHVVSKDGKKFRLEYASHANVVLEKDGLDVARYCLICYEIPVSDLLLAQKLLLETNPERFYNSANVTLIRPNVRAAGFDFIEAVGEEMV